MELFTINRYDETKLNEDAEKAQEELILQKLQARKEKKARLRTPQTAVELQETANQSSESLVNTVAHESSDETLNGGAPTDETENGEQSDEERTETQSGMEQDADESASNNDNEEKVQKTAGAKQLGDFIVLGGDKLHRLKQTDEVLPPWLSHPTIIQHDLSAKGPSIKQQSYLDDRIKANLKSMGFKRLFPVQEKVIPWILEAHQKPAPFWPRDVCISSPTGSGKTLAFAVPVVQLLLKRVAPAIRALVILPVQELAEQVFQVFRQLCDGTNIHPVVLSRGMQLEVEQQKLVKYCNGEYMPKVDIVVTTAGRLIEHLHSTKGFTLRHLRFLIVDEADKVMNQIQNDWLYHLNKHVKHESDEYLLGRTADLLSQSELFDRARQPHKLLFSATFKRDAEKLKTLKLFHPKLFTAVIDPQERTMMAQSTATTQAAEPRRGNFAGQYTIPAELKECICLTEQRSKPLTLYGLIRENGYRKFLVFTNGINTSHRLSFVLQRLFGTDMVIEEWSSSLSPATRKSVLNRFSLGKVNGIICTDALARGIDIENIEVVISYDMPNHIDKYIHRIGRTARAGLRGTAITLLAEDEKKKFNALLKEANKRELETMEVSPSLEEEFAAKYANVLNDLREALELETEVINKIRKGISIGNITRVNLLTKLKDQVDITYSTEIIKTLKILPKSWTNEEIEQRAMQGMPKKNKRKAENIGDDQPNGDGGAAEVEVGTETTANGKVKGDRKKRKLNVAPAVAGKESTGNGTPPTTEDSGATKQAAKRKRKKAKLSTGVANGTSIANGNAVKSVKSAEKKGKVKKNRWRSNAPKSGADKPAK
ncbi:probable ATP-dependent RNA helicase Dbp73D [Anopheles gambiae]|uniref:probable ATP-dependent RNA helicase Dbp73D n=1 Tax=Anopheles coluzzii TaxID=1518534 RepID=UPI0020FF897E|nr:probable ATP-dependent RNA helicase Dbp73D [Anopheles coluzzii]XP_308815.5 probable ATP-dependent RNA helicase Dbp73D [Anopheles gambiae]